MPLKFIANGLLNTFISNSNLHKAILILNSDSTFQLHNLNGDAFDLTIGRYYCKNTTIVFMWDSIKTYLSINDTAIYKKYFRVRKPTAFKINNVVYSFNKKHTPHIIERETFDKIEIFFNANQLFTRGFISDSLRNFPNPIYINMAKNKLTLNKKFSQDVVFPLDSVWGFRALSDNGLSGFVMRINYNNLFNYKILQYNEICIYSVYVPGFHGGHTNYYFSDGLNGQIFSLNNANLIECYKNTNNQFCTLLKTDKKLRTNFFKNKLIDKNQNGEFRIITAYKKSLKN